MTNLYTVVYEGSGEPIPNSEPTTFDEANDLMQHLRTSPQWDHCISTKMISTSPDKLHAQTTEVGKWLWINRFGSDRLRRTQEHGYTCEETYLLERASHEGLEGYDIDFCRSMDAKLASCPSIEAIDELERLSSRYHPKLMQVRSVRNIREGHSRWYDCPHKVACVVSFMGYDFFKYV